MGAVSLRRAPDLDGGGTQIPILYSSKGDEDVSGSSSRLVMALHEAGCGMVRRAVFDLQEGQGRASETARQDAAVRYPVVEMGGYYDGFYH